MLRMFPKNLSSFQHSSVGDRLCLTMLFRSGLKCLPLVLALVLVGCDHPLHIVGQGDIISASNSRNCLAEQQPCSNMVSNNYVESYSAIPRSGWRFVGWEGCSTQLGRCDFNVSADTVHQYWGQTTLPLVAYFERLNQIEVSSGPGRTVAEGDSVSLRGSVTISASDSVSINYQWTQVSGISVTLNNANQLTTSFTAPPVNQAEQLVFKLAASGNTVAPNSDITIVNVLPAPTGVNFVDIFSSDSRDQYAIEAQSGSPSVTWQSSGKQLQIETGDDTAISLKALVSSSTSGILQLDFTPYRIHPNGGQISIKLMQDEYNYYEIHNSDGYGPGQLKKVIGGELAVSSALPAEYFQLARFDLNLYFSPSLLSASGLGRAASLSGNSSPIAVDTISIELSQQDAFIDDIIYTPTRIPYIVALGDSLTRGDGDDALLGDSIGYPPILENQLFGASFLLHAVFNEGIDGHKASNGASRIREVLERHPASDSLFIQYGSNDAINGVSSGLGLKFGEFGYASSYKASMQKIIDTVSAANKQIHIAKPPKMTGPEAANNVRLEQYNQVIDELLSENGIAATQPDFYCYFSFFPQQLSDNLHPNNEGYIAMARIWSNIFLGLSNTCVP